MHVNLGEALSWNTIRNPKHKSKATKTQYNKFLLQDQIFGPIYFPLIRSPTLITPWSPSSIFKICLGLLGKCNINIVKRSIFGPLLDIQQRQCPSQVLRRETQCPTKEGSEELWVPKRKLQLCFASGTEASLLFLIAISWFIDTILQCDTLVSSMEMKCIWTFSASIIFYGSNVILLRKCHWTLLNIKFEAEAIK